MSNLRQLSRDEYRANDDIPNRDELKLGTLQRIADATELMAKRYTDLIRERDMYKQFCEDKSRYAGKLERRNAALRGQITKLRKKLAAPAPEGEVGGRRIHPTPENGMTNKAAMALSVRLQDIASSLDDLLSDIAGERCSFVLMIGAGETVQYVSNTDREDGRKLIEELLDRWNAKRADIPAHMNPDLPRDA